MNVTEMLICKAKTETGVEVNGFIHPDSFSKKVYWYLSAIDDDCFMVTYLIDPSTIRRVTPAVDKNGKRIFEGEFVKVTGKRDGRLYFEISTMSWMIRFYEPDKYEPLCYYQSSDLELIEEPKL